MGKIMAPDGRMVKRSKIRLHDDSKHTLSENDIALCGTAGELWCHTCHPTPAGRCPFEYDDDHAPADDDAPEVQRPDAAPTLRLSLALEGGEPSVYFSSRGTVVVWLENIGLVDTPEIRLEMSLSEAGELVRTFGKFGVFA